MGRGSVTLLASGSLESSHYRAQRSQHLNTDVGHVDKKEYRKETQSTPALAQAQAQALVGRFLCSPVTGCALSPAENFKRDLTMKCLFLQLLQLEPMEVEEKCVSLLAPQSQSAHPWHPCIEVIKLKGEARREDR